MLLPISNSDLKNLTYLNLYWDRVELRYEEKHKLSHNTVSWTVIKQLPSTHITVMLENEAIHLQLRYNEGLKKLLPKLTYITIYRSNTTEALKKIGFTMQTIILHFGNLNIQFDSVFDASHYRLVGSDCELSQGNYADYETVKVVNEYMPGISFTDAPKTEVSQEE